MDIFGILMDVLGEVSKNIHIPVLLKIYPLKYPGLTWRGDGEARSRPIICEFILHTQLAEQWRGIERHIFRMWTWGSNFHHPPP